MSQGRLIGDAYIAILPQLSAFRADAESGIKRILGTMDPKVRVGADTNPFLAEVEAAKEAITRNGPIRMVVGADIAPAQRGIAELLAESALLRERLRNIPLSTDDHESVLSIRKFSSDLNDLIRQMDLLKRARVLPPGAADALDSELRRITLGVDKLDTKLAHLDPHMSAEDAINQLALMRAQVIDISAGLKDLTIDPNDVRGKAKLDSLQVQVLTIAKELRNMTADADILPMQAKLSALIAEARAFQVALAPKTVSPVDLASAATQYAAAGRAVVQLGKDIEAFGKDAPPELAAVSIALADLNRRGLALENFDPVDPKAITDVKNLASDTSRLVAAFNRIPPSASTVAAANQKAARGFGILGGAIAGLRNIDIPLFATSMKYSKDAGILDKGLTNLGHSFLTTASGAHILTQGIIEMAAVWGPAIIGITAFGIAASPVVKQVRTQLTNMNTAATATGQAFNSMVKGAKGVDSGLNDFSKAIQPQVLQLWGDWLTITSKTAGHFGNVLTSIGGVLDNFGAKIAMVLNSKTTSNFLSHAAGDIKGLGVAFQQVGRILATLAGVLPGYAEKLLVLGGGILKVAADFTQAIAPVLKWFLALHGAVFYLGLASTILLTFGRNAITAFTAVKGGEAVVASSNGKLATWGAALGSAAGNLANAGKAAKGYVLDIAAIAKYDGKAAAGSAVLSDAIGAVPFGPLGLAALAAAAIIGGVLYLALSHSTDKAAAFGAQMQKLIANSTAANLQGNIASAIQQTSDQLAQATKRVNELATAYKGLGQAGQVGASGKEPYAMAQAAAGSRQQQQEYSAQLTKIYGQYTTGALRLNQLSNAYGGVNSAMAIMNLAGVKQSDLANAQADAWALDQQKINATAAAYGFMGQQAGTLGNQLDTLTISTGATTQAVQQLVSAEQGWISIITGGDSAFTTFEQGQATLADSLKNGAKSAATFTVSVGKLSEKYSTAGASMNGTTQAALAARQAFDSQIQAGAQLYGNLQMLAAAAGNTRQAQGQLAASGKDIVGQLLQMAGGSKQATTLVFALAQMVGYKGVNSFQALAKWVGNTSKATQNLDQNQQALTAESALLSKAAQNLGNSLINAVVASQTQAILSSTKFNNIQNSLINTLRKTHGQMDTNAVQLAGQYYNALVAAGIGTVQATNLTDALLQKLGAAPGTIDRVNAALYGMQNAADAAKGALQQLVNTNWAVHVQYLVTGQVPGGPGGVPYVPGAAPVGVTGPGGPRRAAGGTVRGSGPSGKDSTLTMLAPGELVIPTSHAPKYTAMAKRDGVPGLASGGFNANGLSPVLNPAQSAVTGPQMQPMTQVQGMTLIQLLQSAVKLLQHQPQALGTVINNGTAQGARHAFFAAGG